MIIYSGISLFKPKVLFYSFKIVCLVLNLVRNFIYALKKKAS